MRPFNVEENKSNLCKNKEDMEMDPVKIKFSTALIILSQDYLLSFLRKILCFLSSDKKDLIFDIERPYRRAFLLELVRNKHNLKCSKFNADCKNVAEQIIGTLKVNKHVYKWTYEIVTLDKNKRAHPKLIYKKKYLNRNINKKITMENITSTPLKLRSSVNLFNKCTPSCQCKKSKPILSPYITYWIKKTITFIKNDVQLNFEYPRMSKTQAKFMYNMIQQPYSIHVCTNADYYEAFVPIWQAMRIFERKYIFQMIYMKKSKEKTKYLMLQKLPRTFEDDNFSVDFSSSEIHNVPNFPPFMSIKDNVSSVSCPSTSTRTIDPGQKLLEAMTKSLESAKPMSVRSSVDSSFKENFSYTNENCSHLKQSMKDDIPSVSCSKLKTIEADQKQLEASDSNVDSLLENHIFNNDNIKSPKQSVKVNMSSVKLSKLQTDMGLKLLEAMSKPLKSDKDMSDRSSVDSLLENHNSINDNIKSEQPVKGNVSSVKLCKVQTDMDQKLLEAMSKPLESDKAISDRSSVDSLLENHNSINDNIKSKQPVKGNVSSVKLCKLQTDMGLKLLEAMSKPLESDKAIRMMRLMGWQGGALGLYGQGITEPIIPVLNVVRGAGFGHIPVNPKNLPRIKPLLPQKLETSKKNEINEKNEASQPEKANSQISKWKEMESVWRMEFFQDILDLIESEAECKIFAATKKRKKMIRAVIGHYNNCTIYAPENPENMVLQKKIVDELSAKCQMLEYGSVRKGKRKWIKITKTNGKTQETKTPKGSKKNKKKTSKVKEPISCLPMRQFTTYQQLPSNVPQEDLTKNSMDAIWNELGYNKSSSNNQSQVLKVKLKIRAVILVKILEFLKSFLPIKVYILNETLNIEQCAFICDVVKMTTYKENKWSAYSEIERKFFKEVCGLPTFGLDVKFGQNYKTFLLTRFNEPQTSKAIEMTEVEDDTTDDVIIVNDIEMSDENEIISISSDASQVTLETCDWNVTESSPMSCEETRGVAAEKNTDYDVIENGLAGEKYEKQITTIHVMKDNVNGENENTTIDNNIGTVNSVANIPPSIDFNENEKLIVRDENKNIENGKDLTDGKPLKGENENCVVIHENADVPLNTETKENHTNTLLYLPNEEQNGVVSVKTATDLIKPVAEIIEEKNIVIENGCENDIYKNSLLDSPNETENSFGVVNNATELIKTEAENIEEKNTENEFEKDRTYSNKILDVNEKQNDVTIAQGELDLINPRAESVGKQNNFTENVSELEIIGICKLDGGEKISLDFDKQILELEKATKDGDNENVQSNKSPMSTNTDSTMKNMGKRIKLKPTTYKNLCIVPINYPQEEINIEIIKDIQKLIDERIDDSLPKLQCNGVVDGGLVYGCHDEKSSLWLQNCFANTNFKIIEYNSHRITMRVNTYLVLNETFFGKLEMYNEGLNTKKWVVNQAQSYNDHFEFTLTVDDKSFKYICDANLALYAGIDKARFSIIWDDV